MISTEDQKQIEQIWKQNSKYLGNFYFVKDTFSKEGHEWFYVCGLDGVTILGFAHCQFMKKMGKWELKEIAVHDDYKREGIGEILLNCIPTDVFCKTDADNERSRAFYKKHGFMLMGSTKSRKGKEMVVYERISICAQS